MKPPNLEIPRIAPEPSGWNAVVGSLQKARKPQQLKNGPKFFHKRSITYIYKNKCEAPGRQTYTYISTPQCELLFGSFLSGTTELHTARDSLCNGDTVWWKFFTAVWYRIVASWHATVFSVSFHSLMKVFNVWDGQAQWNWRLETPSRASDGYAVCQRVCVRLVSSWIWWKMLPSG